MVSAGGTLISKADRQRRSLNPACVDVEDHVEDGTENYRSIGVLFRYGAFRFLDVGDLSGNTLTRLGCPRNMIGNVSAYLIAHHGDYDTSVPSLYAALQPQVSIMNNGPTRGGDRNAFLAARHAPGADLWQLHPSRFPDAANAPDEFIANVDDGTSTSFGLVLTASDDGSFRMTNPAYELHQDLSQTAPLTRESPRDPDEPRQFESGVGGAVVGICDLTAGRNRPASGCILPDRCSPRVE